MWQLQQPDKNGWIDLRINLDPRTVDGLMNHFFQNLENDEIDQYRNVINHFSSEINDKQIHNVLNYFRHFKMSWRIIIFGEPNQQLLFFVQTDLCFETSGRSRWDLVFFGIEWDNFYNQYRIVSVRVMENSKWKIRKTVFQAETKDKNWRKMQHIFGKALVMI